MWEINNASQLTSFLISIGFGVVYSFLYDILRAIRKTKSTSDITVFFQDVLYFLIIAFITFMLLMSLSNGEIRGYIIFGLIIGFVICFLTLSRVTVKFFSFFLKILNRVSEKIIGVINGFFDKVEEFVTKTVEKSIEFLKNTKKLFKKHLK